MLATATGCKDEKRQLAELAERSMERQAMQNEWMARLQQEVAQGSRQLVEADAAARQAATDMQGRLQAERAEVNRQRDLLSAERGQVEARRLRDPLIASAVMQVGIVLACIAPLALCWLLLRRPAEPASDMVIAETLLEDMVAPRPLLLAREPASEPAPFRRRHLPLRPVR
jgi:hypothetical protein